MFKKVLYFELPSKQDISAKTMNIIECLAQESSVAYKFSNPILLTPDGGGELYPKLLESFLIEGEPHLLILSFRLNLAVNEADFEEYAKGITESRVEPAFRKNLGTKLFTSATFFELMPNEYSIGASTDGEYKVTLFNDDVTTFETVEFLLKEVFGYNEIESEAIAKNINEKGSYSLGRGIYEDEAKLIERILSSAGIKYKLIKQG